MMKRHRSLFLGLFVPALLLVSVFAVVEGAQQPSSSAVKGGRWSDAATWADKKVPAAGAIVTINQGMDVVLDVNTPPLNGLTINGKLSFANNKDLELTTEWIICLLYTSDAADERSSVDLGGRRIIKKK